MKAKRISLYLTAFFYSKQKENMTECEINIICRKLKKYNKKENKKYLNKYLYSSLHLILYFIIY